jgi:pimeloyl-ACP methyl ester carboxylesterase
MTCPEHMLPSAELVEDAPVIAFHCSGGTGRQWRSLVAALAPRTVTAPDLFGTRARGHWTGREGFQLMDEAQPILNTLHPTSGKVHLVGHSYGGALALHIARRLPDRVASLSLYEPTAFQFLKNAVERETIGGLHRISDLMAASCGAPGDPDFETRHAACAAQFVAFWSGPEAWQRMSEHARGDVICYIPKASDELAALLAEPADHDAYRALTYPVLLLRGTDRNPAATVTAKLAEAIPWARLRTIPGAGHMGPLTHPENVASAIRDHIACAEQYAQSTHPECSR